MAEEQKTTVGEIVEKVTSRIYHPFEDTIQLSN